MTPIRLSIAVSSDAIHKESCPPLEDELENAKLEVHHLKSEVWHRRQIPLPAKPSEDTVIEMDEPQVLHISNVGSATTFVPFLAMNTGVGTTYRLGIKDLVNDVEGE